MGAKDYNRLFSEAEKLAETRAAQSGRAPLPADERAAADEVYLKWVEEERFDELISALEGMFNPISILSYRLEFLTDFATELEGRRDLARIHALFERTVPGVWRAYLRQRRHAKEGLLGNVAEAATRKGELLTMLYDYFEAAYRLGDLPLAERIRTEALRFASEDRFDPKMKAWRSAKAGKNPGSPEATKARGKVRN